MKLQTMLEQINGWGFPDIEIAKRLSEKGNMVSQSTICRIRNGDTSTRYEIGKAIEMLYTELVATNGSSAN